MERRMLLAVVLSFLVVTLYSMATGQCQPPPRDRGGPERPDGPQAEAGPPAAPAAPGQDEANPPAPPAPGETEPQAEVPEQRAGRLANEAIEVGFTSQGAAIEFVRLRRSLTSDRARPLDLVLPLDPMLLLGQVDDALATPAPSEAPGRADRREAPPGPLRALHWTRDEAAEAATPEEDVVYRFQTRTGGAWTKRWFLDLGEDRHTVRVRIAYRPGEGEAAQPRALTALVSSGLLREEATGATFLYPNMALYRLSNQGEPVTKVEGLAVNDAESNKLLNLLGARSHYYLAGYYGSKGREGAPTVQRWWATGEEGSRRPAMERAALDFFARTYGRPVAEDPVVRNRVVAGVAELHHVWMAFSLPDDGTETDMPLYVGPIDRHVLAQAAYEPIEPVITYPGAFDIVAEALLGIYDLFRHLFGSAGLAVILMTLVVRGLMMPLSIKNQLSMRAYSRKIQRIKPKIDVLKKKYGNNVRKLREEQTRLYREHGVGFPLGCLMMLVQLPIFFALFSCLRTEYSLRNASFLWIGDLSGPDRLVDLGTTLDLMVVTVFSLNLLPLLMVALSLWQQRLMPKPADEQQAQQMRMMKWLPIVFAVILYNYTAALALYMVLSSAVSIVESRIVRSRDAADVAAGESEAAGS
jgi:YidC/Oxa1 family membrane protein insertase